MMFYYYNVCKKCFFGRYRPRTPFRARYRRGPLKARRIWTTTGMEAVQPPEDTIWTPSTTAASAIYPPLLRGPRLRVFGCLVLQAARALVLFIFEACDVFGGIGAGF